MSTATLGLASPPSFLTRYRPEIDAELRALVEGRPAAFSPQVRYQLGWIEEQGRPLVVGGGKALRPSLLLLVCDGLGGDRSRALHLAAALELVHNFSLVHDDVQDGDRERRHHPTAWVLWGVPQAINLGDALAGLALSAIRSATERGLSPSRTLQARSILAKACLELIEGQQMDLSLEGEKRVSLPDYLMMAERKTGALMGAALELGALVAGAAGAQHAACRQAGRTLGLAFQVRDDCLAIWSDRSETGKDAGGDILRKKKSLPVVFGLSQTGAPAAELGRIYRRNALSLEDVERVRCLLTEARALTYARGLADELGQTALLQLQSVGLAPWAQEELRLLVDYLIQTQVG
jgi:geranylgeranyl diphosphate synthase type I